MGWIVQEYEGDAHVIPDTEPGHVLSADCFCQPTADAIDDTATGIVYVHHDEADRILAASD